MKIILLCVGATKTSFVLEGCADYLLRIKHYVPTELMALPEKKVWRKLPPEQRRIAEGAEILEKLQPGDLAILLDEKGQLFDSRTFADKLQKYMVAGPHRLVFIIGGAYGFSEAVYKHVKTRLSLSPMTFNHEMVRLFVLEQLYRGMSILRGEPYHND